MLDHLAIAVSDLTRSKAFYTATLRPLGYAPWHEDTEGCGFGVADGHGRSLDPGGDFWIVQGTPGEARPHLAFSAGSPDAVAAFHAAALAAGGVDNGGPGLRPTYHPAYYAAFVFDPDGYNIEAVCHTAD